MGVKLIKVKRFRDGYLGVAFDLRFPEGQRYLAFAIPPHGKYAFIKHFADYKEAKDTIKKAFEYLKNYLNVPSNELPKIIDVSFLEGWQMVKNPLSSHSCKNCNRRFTLPEPKWLLSSN